MLVKSQEKQLLSHIPVSEILNSEILHCINLMYMKIATTASPTSLK